MTEDFHGSDGSQGFEDLLMLDDAVWDAALNGAVTSLLFGAVTQPPATDDALHAAFEAMLFGDVDVETSSSETGPVAWIANDDAAPAGYGRIMLTRPSGVEANSELPGLMDVDGPQIASNAAIRSGRAANDNSIWIGTTGDDDQLGVLGRDPVAAMIGNGDTIVAWIGIDNAIHATCVPKAPSDAAPYDFDDAVGRAKLEQLLAGLGDAASAFGGRAGRIALTAIAPASIAAVWTCEFAMNSVLMGKILTSSAAAGDGASAAAWSVASIAPQNLPAGARLLEVGVNAAGELEVSVPQPSGEAPVVIALHSDGFDADFTLANLLSENDDAADAMSGAPTPPLSLVSEPQQSADPADIMSAANAAQTETARDTDDDGSAHHDEPGSTTITIEETFAITANDDSAPVEQVAPEVAVSDNGTPTVMHIVPGSEPGAPSQIIITPLDAQGHASGAPVVVTSNAVTSDAEHPTLDVGPALTGTHEGVAVAWVEKTDGNAGSDAPQLLIQAYDDDCAPISQAPVTVTASHDPDATYSDIASGYTHRGSDGHGDGARSSEPGGVLAVAWVENASDDGYGVIGAQFFTVPDSDGSDGQDRGLTAVGHDGVAGGDDATFTLGSDSDGIGRAPQVEGLTDGALAVAWVEHAEYGNRTSPEVVRGVIVTPGSNAPGLDLDLAGLMTTGLAAGTEPVLTTDAAGDLIVGWIQNALAGGYQSAAAIYRHGDDGRYNPPSSSMILNSYAYIPDDFTIAVSGSGEDMTLIVAWRDEDNDVQAMRYDVSSGASGPEFMIHTDSDRNDRGGLSLANLADGELLVVYSNNDGRDSDILGTVLDLPSDRSGSGSGSNSGKGNNSGSGSDDLDGASSAAMVDFTQDLIQFINDEVAEASAAASAPLAVVSTDAATEFSVPTAADVAALEALVTPPAPVKPTTVSSSNSCDAGDTSGSGSSGSSSSGSGSGGSSSSGSGKSGSDDDRYSDNDNSGYGGESMLAFNSGFGNDIPDYLSADEQAALVPEPISILFEALQFANAFSNCANEDVLVFDGSNVVSITQLNTTDGWQTTPFV